MWIFDDDDDDDNEEEVFSPRFTECRQKEYDDDDDDERKSFNVDLLCRFPVEEDEKEKVPIAEREDIKFGRIDNIFFCLPKCFGEFGRQPWEMTGIAISPFHSNCVKTEKKK